MAESTSRASVPTERPGKYIAQLCKHFAHRIPTTFDPPTSDATTGRIEFEGGVCTLRSEPELLVMELTATDVETLHRLEGVVARHLERFAWREPPVITWS